MKRANDDGEDEPTAKRVQVALGSRVKRPQFSVDPVDEDAEQRTKQAQDRRLAAAERNALSALLQLLKTVDNAQLEPHHRYSVTDLQLTCKTLRKTWIARWRAAHTSWASHGNFPELEINFVYNSEVIYLGTGFLWPARLWDVNQYRLEASSAFVIAKFARKSCFAIELGAEVMLAKYYAAHCGPLLKPTAEWNRALEQILVAAMRRNCNRLVAVVHAMSLRLFGAEYLLSACDRADAAPEGKLAALAAVADLCGAEPARREALMVWLKRERKKKRCTDFAWRCTRELSALRGAVDSARLLHVIAFLHSIK